ncbi:MAG TPA: hypothetical protein VIH71_10270 [Solirubrobacteraceae bacterium]
MIAGVGFAVTVAGQVAAGLGEAKNDDSDPLAADVVPEENLKDLRGGMDMNGLVGYFAIDRVVQVDGEVVAKMQIVVTNLDRLASGGMPTISVSGPVAELVQVMSGGAGGANLAAATKEAATAAAAQAAEPRTAAASPAGAAPVSPDEITVAHTGASASAGSPSVTGASSPASTTSSQGAASLQANVQVGPQASSGTPGSAAMQQSTGANATAGITRIIPIGSTGQFVVISNLPNAASLATVVQNEVRGTTIQTQTTITASLNSLTALNGLSLASAIQQQVALSVHH